MHSFFSIREIFSHHESREWIIDKYEKCPKIRKAKKKLEEEEMAHSKVYPNAHTNAEEYSVTARMGKEIRATKMMNSFSCECIFVMEEINHDFRVPLKMFIIIYIFFQFSQSLIHCQKWSTFGFSTAVSIFCNCLWNKRESECVCVCAPVWMCALPNRIHMDLNVVLCRTLI